MKYLFSFKATLTLSASFSLLMATDLMANSCTKADIDYYLQRGFTHNQVVRLCSSTTKQSQPLLNTNNQKYESINTPTPSNGQYSSIKEDRVYFETVLKANTATLTPSSLSYVSRECKKYGDANLAGLQDKACANTRVTINFKGLQVIKAVKGVFLIRDQQMLIQGDIHREFLDINSLNPRKQAVIRTQLPTSPSSLDLPVRRGIDPKQVAEKLKKYITP